VAKKIKIIFFLIINSGSTFSITFLSLILLIILHGVGFFYPIVLTQVNTANLSNTLILVVLTEILFLNINKEKKNADISKNESDFTAGILSDAEKGLVREVSFISAGLSSRYLFISELIKNNVRVKVLVQGENIAVDQVDLKRLPSMINSIELGTPGSINNFLEIRSSKNIVSLRAVIVNYKDNYYTSIVSWYTYDQNNNILGHNNPVIFSNEADMKNEILSIFAREKFDYSWEESSDKIIYPQR
jgi:hypothetical protein